MRGIDPAAFDAELDRLAPSWQRFWPHADVAAMAVDVERRAVAAIESWGLRAPEILAGGQVALVCGAVRSGRDVVLKVRPRGHGEERSMVGEVAALGACEGSGAAVSLLDVADGDLTLLLERLSPGTALDREVLDGEARLRILGEVAARLHAAAPGRPTRVVDLAEDADFWRRNLADRPSDLAELDSLLVGPAEKAVLHNDLHGGNVLRGGDRWIAIDPNAAYGDRAAEIWSLIDPLSPLLEAGPDAAWRGIGIFAAAAGVDPLRASRWARVRALAESVAIERNQGAVARELAWARKMRGFAEAVGPGVGR